MPNRIIKESICTSDSLENLTWFEEVLFYRLIVNCDDFGRYDGRPAIIKNRLFPLKDDLPMVDVVNGLIHLSQAGLITCYEHDGKPYLFLTTWEDHQTIRAKRSKYPSPDDGTITHEIICKQMRADENICNQVKANVHVIQSNPIQPESNSYKGRKFAPPTLEEVKAYCQERGNIVNAERWFDYYTSNGWKVGKNPMKDWRAAVRTWEKDKPKQTGPAYKDDVDRLLERFGNG